jgi:hypothetical protein
MMPFVAVGKSEFNPCQLIKLRQAKSLMGKSLVQNAGELPSQNGIKSKSCFTAIRTGATARVQDTPNNFSRSPFQVLLLDNLPTLENLVTSA